MRRRKQSEVDEEQYSQDEYDRADDAMAEDEEQDGLSARSMASDASRSLAIGFSALKEVRQASKMRADAEADVRDIERGLEEDRDELDHREDVERNYAHIVATEKAEIKDARARMQSATNSITKQQDEVSKLTEELRLMRERHEQELRPYRNLMDSSRGRSDDSAKSLANIRRATKNAERAFNEATKNRDTRISTAHRAVDNAQERVGALDADLNSLRMSADTDGTAAAAIAKTESELASNQRALEFARNEVVQVTKEAQDAVDQAQRKLLSLQRELAQAERVAETNKTEATAHKDEYDSMYREAQAQEKAKEDAIKACESRINELTRARNAAHQRMEDARDVLEEANEIHAHPETTEGLRERIADEEADLEYAQADLEELLEIERELRRNTRGTRLIVFAIAAAIVLLIALCVWFFVIPH